MISFNVFVVLSYADILVYGILDSDDDDDDESVFSTKLNLLVNGKIGTSTVRVKKKTIRLIARYPSHNRWSFVMPSLSNISHIGMLNFVLSFFLPLLF
jgi:hypothetical protein